jgi:hypothetical protein
LPEVRQRLPGPRLWLGDRQFCDLDQVGRFAAAGDHFLARYHPKVHFHADGRRPPRRGTDAAGRGYTEGWGWLGAATDRRRRYVRRITLERPGEEALVLVSDLLDVEQYPAADLLAAYLARWGIEGMFQKVTEVFALKRLIGGSPQAGVFQLAFCLLLYNMIHVLRAYVAAAEDWEPDDISLEKLFDDVERELTAWTVLVSPAQGVAVLTPVPTVPQVKRRLAQLLQSVWRDRWLKAVNEKPRPHKAREKAARTHTSVHRILAEHQRQQQSTSS